MATTLDWDGNLLLACVAEADRPLLAPHLRSVELSRGAVLFEPGDDVTMTYFPCRGTIISLVTMLQDGHALEAAVVGYEGSIGGVVSFGHKPAFARMTVEIGGAAWCMATERLDEAKARSPALHDLFSRYADVMLAQTLQSVACNALHSIEQRACRWLLTMQEQVGDGAVVPVSQEYLANLLGVQRTSVSAAAQALQARGLIRYSRGVIRILDRAALAAESCDCYAAVEKHFRTLLPAVKRKEAQLGPPLSRAV